MNPFGRRQETEADYLGLIFSSLAGYDIRESIKLWERMSSELKPDSLSSMGNDVTLEELPNTLNEILNGKITGRTVVNL